MIRSLVRRARARSAGLPRVAVERFGIPPAWLGYRYWQRETVSESVRRTGNGSLQVIHPERVHTAPLPRNVPTRHDLPDKRGWWGFSFRDVPARHNAPTFTATLPDCTLVHYREPPDHTFAGDYHVGILNADQRSLELREIRFRPGHADALKAKPRAEHFERATWIIERVYHNHSHWLTAHLPKLVLLRDRGALGDVLLPPALPAGHLASLRLLGLNPADFRTYDPAAVQRVGELTVLGTDRFRPELLALLRQALAPVGRVEPHRRVYISRARAARRRLLNEEEIWPLLERAGFQRVRMEELAFEQQVELMAETAVLFAPHGAGLTNMMFCAPGTHVVEIADLSFPNPNFYALASALGHEYWLLSGEPIGDQHPLERDMTVDPAAVRELLPALELAARRGGTDPDR